jgi:hypothetical protein
MPQNGAVGNTINLELPEGFGTKFKCLIKCDLYNLDEVWSKGEDEMYNVHKLSMKLNFQKKF